MQNRQNIFFISAIVLLAMIALVEGIVLLRNSPRWNDWTAAVSQTFRAMAAPKTNQSQKEKDDIILQETAEDLERMQNQINRIFYEMTKDASFTRQNISRLDPHARQNPFQPPDNIQRFQDEIAHIFQRAQDSRHIGALNLIEQDWQNVDETSSLNLEEDRTNYVVTVSMPGFNKTNINVNLTGRILTVEATAEHRPAAQDSQATHSGCFKTQIMLPNDITGESARAFYENSILKVTIPKKPASNSLARKVTIM